MSQVDHPLQQEILAVRQIILAADPSITEGIKWNVTSFRTTEYFATFHLRAPDSIQIILHLGAKKRDTATTGISIDDPQALLTWLAKDRAAVRFHSLQEIEAKRDAFTHIIRQWIQYV